MTTRAEVIAILRANPDGMTTKQMAEQLKSNQSNVGGYLSRMADYGMIDRFRTGPGAKMTCIWKAKDDDRNS